VDTANTYSLTWFELFMQPIQPVQTETEAAFLMRHLPLPVYRAVLDLCCGWGRHAHVLARHGYQVTGIDCDPAVIAEAERRTGTQSEPIAPVTYLVHDMRELATLPGSYSAAVNLWQSFGYYDAAANAGILGQLNRKLMPAGRVILDIYHRDFFASHQGVHSFERDGVCITERKRMQGNRLTVTLDYGALGRTHTFSWQLYTPDDVRMLAEQQGFTCQVACSHFDESMPPSDGTPRMQFVLEKRADPAWRPLP
jgi:SAM-dependent methyltransferase